MARAAALSGGQEASPQAPFRGRVKCPRPLVRESDVLISAPAPERSSESSESSESRESCARPGPLTSFFKLDLPEVNGSTGATGMMNELRYAERPVMPCEPGGNLLPDKAEWEGAQGAHTRRTPSGSTFAGRLWEAFGAQAAHQ